MEPLWDRVDRNRVRLAVSVVVFVVGSVLGVDAVLALAFAVPALIFHGEAEFRDFALSVISVGTALSFAGALAYVWVALSRSEHWLVRRLGATLVPRGELMETKYALKDMSIAAGLGVAPALYVLETNNVNAFVFAASRRRPIVGVTRGLAERLDQDEQRAVFANLCARLRSGDTIFATGVTALMRPLWAYRDAGITRFDDSMEDPVGAPDVWASRVTNEGATYGVVLYVFGLALAFVMVTEVIAFGHRRSQLRLAEVADAEGMLLLREPVAMLDALQKAVRYDNVVSAAGAGFAQLFYCWTEDSSNDGDDPEVRRIARLREVLGVEGMAWGDGLIHDPERTGDGLPPVAPRIDPEQ